VVVQTEQIKAVEAASDCNDHPLSSGDNVTLQVDRLGETNSDRVRVRRSNSIGINRIAADTWGTITAAAADRGKRRWFDSASAYCCGPAQGY
jgi:hypothetical protein